MAWLLYIYQINIEPGGGGGDQKFRQRLSFPKKNPGEIGGQVSYNSSQRILYQWEKTEARNYGRLATELLSAPCFQLHMVSFYENCVSSYSFPQ